MYVIFDLSYTLSTKLPTDLSSLIYKSTDVRFFKFVRPVKSSIVIPSLEKSRYVIFSASSRVSIPSPLVSPICFTIAYKFLSANSLCLTTSIVSVSA